MEGPGVKARNYSRYSSLNHGSPSEVLGALDVPLSEPMPFITSQLPLMPFCYINGLFL